MVISMNIQEYEELFGSYESHDDEEFDNECVVSYATKKECEKLIKKYKRKICRIPKRCKICVNCSYLYEHWWECDCYDTYCTHPENQHRRYLGYCPTDEKDTCNKWEWNKWQLVDPETWTTLDTRYYK